MRFLDRTSGAPLSAATQSDSRAAAGVALRPMRAADAPAAHRLSEAVQWPHRLVDWKFVVALGEGVVAERDGAVVGSGLVWNWGPAHATLGLVIVDPACQGQRIGIRLMQALLEIAGERSILLHATAEGRGLYERLGFVQAAEVRQHQGQAAHAPLVALESGARLRPASRRDLARLVALDAAACGMPRDALIRKLVETAETVVLDHDGQPRGFSMLRRFGRGWVIGPVVAPDAEAARALIAHWVARETGKFVRIDTDYACGLTGWLETLGLKRVGNPTAMVRGAALVRGAAVKGMPARAFALVSQALG